MTTATKAIIEMTPVEIDTILAANWDEYFKVAMDRRGVADYIKRGERYEDNPKGWYRDSYYGGKTLEANRKRYAELGEKLAVLVEEAKPYTDEYRRRPWNRYYLVTNTNGHVHRGMNCNTCFPTTEYRWIVELADCDETAMVAEYGEMACTVCFPEAPTMPGFGDGTSGYAKRTQAEKDARQAEKDARNAAKAAKNLASHLQFTDSHGWRVETLAGAKQALRGAIEARLMKDRKETWERAGYFAEKAAEAVRVEADARHALDAKGVTTEEVAKIEANVTKKVRKDYPLAGI